MQTAVISVLMLLAVAGAPLQSQGASATAADSIVVTRRALPATPEAQPSNDSAQASGTRNFTGPVRVQSVFRSLAPGRAYGADVAFAAGARTAWHTHPAGQTLIVVSGIGRVQQWNAQVREIRVGDVVHIPPGIKHWHGASPDRPMTHLAIVESVEGSSVTWMESVSDEAFAAAPRSEQVAASAGAAPTGAASVSVTPRAMNEFAPALADITNRVLYGEVWPDSSLSARNRSLVTISALIAMNRPDQLRSHLRRAREAGVTREEVAAVITHLAFYAGWPSAVTAVGIAAEVYEAR